MPDPDPIHLSEVLVPLERAGVLLESFVHCGFSRTETSSVTDAIDLLRRSRDALIAVSFSLSHSEVRILELEQALAALKALGAGKSQPPLPPGTGPLFG